MFLHFRTRSKKVKRWFLVELLQSVAEISLSGPKNCVYGRPSDSISSGNKPDTSLLTAGSRKSPSSLSPHSILGIVTQGVDDCKIKWLNADNLGKKRVCCKFLTATRLCVILSKIAFIITIFCVSISVWAHLSLKT